MFKYLHCIYIQQYNNKILNLKIKNKLLMNVNNAV